MSWALGLAAAIGLFGIPERDASGRPHLRSESVLVRFADTKEIVVSKHAEVVRPIASITKLASMAVLLERAADFEPWVEITEDDKDRLKWSRSRLRVGQRYRPKDLFGAALVASDNRAVYALVRSAGYPRESFVGLMNEYAARLGMKRTRFRDPAGVDPENVSTAADLILLLEAVSGLSQIRDVTQQAELEVIAEGGRALGLVNTNRLARSERWAVVLGKTGYTAEAGRGLATRVIVDGRPVDMVFLGAREMASVFGDAARVKRWMSERRLATRPAMGGARASAED